MGKYSCLVNFLSGLLLLLLETFVNGSDVRCYGSTFAVNGSYVENRDHLLSSLATNVVANGGFYNASFERDSSRVYALALCGRGYERQACLSCVVQMIENYVDKCNQMESLWWDYGGFEDEDAICLVRYTNHSTFGKLELEPSYISPSTISIESYKDMNLFSQEWQAMANRTIKAAYLASNSSPLKYYSVTREEFTEFTDVYFMMLCTPDISSSYCNRCLRECVTDFQNQLWGRQGAGIRRPSCYFRWDLYSFGGGAFKNVTRVPAFTQASTSPQGGDESSYRGDKKGKRLGSRTIVIIVFPTVINIFVFIGFIIVFARRRKKSYKEIINECSDFDGQSVLRFRLGMILTATNDFSPENKLGQGGFGAVYKGIFPNGQEIAVKRLVRGLGQGDTEFKNEVLLLSRLQHRNVVKLLGFCNEGDEEILVYELVTNSSLDHFIFYEDKRSLLTWEVRCRIIEGVARGLVYLHEDSQLKIIHRDLKASNILLDAEMNPKVADFGTARLFNTNETRAQTKRIAGTRGYMAPEYLNYGQISAKSDVYSFGVMLLEMISGKRNNISEEGFADFAWKKWVEGNLEIVIDPFLIENSRNEITKLIQIGLLCVQENAAHRPTMSSVIAWLGRETVTIPLPRAPAFARNQSQSENGIMSMSKDFTEISVR